MGMYNGLNYKQMCKIGGDPFSMTVAGLKLAKISNAVSKLHCDTANNMKIGKLLTRGCDIWLNNPIRLMEASGTSGMKTAMNGVLNFSILDGWWPEGAIHSVNGWNIGDGTKFKNQDLEDSKILYRVLIDEILPTFDDKNKWADMMKESIKMSSHNFSSKRMVKDYINKMYNK
jgi:starch phosphorylase